MRIHRHRQRKPKFQIPQFNVNEKILAPEVRVILPDGEHAVMKTADAVMQARAQELDLIEVSPKANPPVCRMMDFGSFKYQKEKEAKKQRVTAKEVEIKGIRLSVRIGEGDMDVRRKQAIKFLEKGSKIRIELILRGREKAYRDRAIEVVNQFIELLKQDFDLRVESAPRMMGGRLQTIVSRNA